jgi:hypothetical protein
LAFKLSFVIDTVNMAISKQVMFLEELQLQFPVLASHFAKFAELYTSKLWHQLTLLLEEAIALPEFQDGDLLIRLYEGFVSEIAQRINLLKLAHFVTAVAKRYTDLQQACGFIETVSHWLLSLPDPVSRHTLQHHLEALLGSLRFDGPPFHTSSGRPRNPDIRPPGGPLICFCSDN